MRRIEQFSFSFVFIQRGHRQYRTYIHNTKPAKAPIGGTNSLPTQEANGKPTEGPNGKATEGANGKVSERANHKPSGRASNC